MSSDSSSKGKNVMHSGSRIRKKRKRLDAICENEYKRNHGEITEGNGLAVSGEPDTELRRSSRARRPPVLPYTSPTIAVSTPEKKRRKVDKSNGGDLSGGRVKENDNQELGGSRKMGGWRLRLRSRNRNLSKRTKLIKGSGESIGKKTELGVGMPTAARSKRPQGSEGLNFSSDVVEEIGDENVTVKSESDDVEVTGNTVDGEDDGNSDVVEIIGNNDEAEDGNNDDEEGDGGNSNEEEVMGNKYNEATPSLEKQMMCGNDEEMIEGNEVSKVIELDEECNRDENKESVGHHDEKEEQSHDEEDGSNERVDKQVDGTSKNEVEDGKSRDCDDVNLIEIEEEEEEEEEEEPFEGGDTEILDKLNLASTDPLRKPRIKQGRQCGLCGGGTDGKPPKKFVQDMGDSENEPYSGSSALEEPNYDTWDGFEDKPGWLGRLLGPINDRYGIAGTWVHQHCAVWSPEVYFAGLGCLKNVRAALCRGRALKCSRCGRPGATLGCLVDRCPKTYHLPCARANGCIFDHRKFLIACTDHRQLFQPQGSNYSSRIKKLKTKKMKFELRKMTTDSWRKDIEAEEKWLENCGEDEEFLKRESKRFHRDMLRIAPVYIGGPDSDSGKSFDGWESVAGLQDVIRCMKEVVILPLLYPEFFNNLGLTPPRGVLLHGYPGTGKTLVVRALIGSCAQGDKRIAYFARKGADCLGKYVGDAERQLRLLFQVAEKCQPSIIFFDEMDGLAPVRTRHQDQTHSSVVSTLLALMDGLKSRGSVVVIGATNRPDAIDPALRRPGRFDREIYFPLPSVKDRSAILSLHTKSWPKPVSGSLVDWIARKTVGFAGADLQALCTQAAMKALKRNFPLQEVLTVAEKGGSGAKRGPLPSFTVEERDWLEALSVSPPPCSRREAGIAAHDLTFCPLPTHLVPCLLQPFLKLIVFLHCDERLWLPPLLSKAVTMVNTVVVSALERKNMPSDRWWLHVDDLLTEAGFAKEIEGRLSSLGIIMSDSGFAGSSCFMTDFDEGNEVEHSRTTHCHSSLLKSMQYASKKKLGSRVLISGSPKYGQKHFASSILHCFAGNVDIQKVDLATIMQEGHGDAVQGITQILARCVSAGSCVIFMPRIDLWAVEASHEVEEDCLSSPAKHQIADKKLRDAKVLSVGMERKSSPTQEEIADVPSTDIVSSRIWSSFVEQVESIHFSTSLMILGTSELAYEVLPHQVRHFFKSGITNSGQSIPCNSSVPQFVAEVGVNFNHDLVMQISVESLTWGVIQFYIQLIHERIHIRPTPLKNIKTCDAACDIKDLGKENSRVQFPEDPSIKVLQPPHDSKILKGRTNLQLAISIFGYQILLYPHFAELCWVTSKLKEGPCADASGPWKTWPFNSCVVRPDNSFDNVVAVAGTSDNAKGKEIFGLVRGLVAVGLSAYRGQYSSLREVTFDVRKVFELLIREINAKVEAGKDRHLYVRISSQVAYLEDVVSNWAYALQSLDHKSPMKQDNFKIGAAESPDKPLCEGDLAERERNCHELNNNGQQLADESHISNDLEKQGNIVPILEKDSSQADTERVVNVTSDQNGRTGLESQNRENPVMLEPSNGLTPSHNGLCSNGLLATETDVEVVLKDQTVNADFSSSQTDTTAADCMITCSYHCCPECLHTLKDLMEKIFVRELKSNGSNITVDDVHDAFSSLSVNFRTAVRKFDADGKLFDPTECSCHLLDLNATVEEKLTPFGNEWRFVIRDGVLVPFDSISDRNASFHCEIGKLCLSSLIKLLGKMNHHIG